MQPSAEAAQPPAAGDAGPSELAALEREQPPSADTSVSQAPTPQQAPESAQPDVAQPDLGKVGAGMQPGVAESATSSNARQQSTSTVASPHASYVDQSAALPGRLSVYSLLQPGAASCARGARYDAKRLFCFPSLLSAGLPCLQLHMHAHVPDRPMPCSIGDLQSKARLNLAAYS